MTKTQKTKDKRGICGPHRIDQRTGPKIKPTRTHVAPPKPPEDDHGKSQAWAQLESVRDMVEELAAAHKAEDDKRTEDAEQRIQEDALSVEVRSDWHSPGAPDTVGATQYKILLCTGGPAVQIIGDLNDYNEPDNATIQYQDWFTPWTDLNTSSDDEKIMLAYARTFYFGE